MNVEWLARLPAPVRRALYFGSQRALGSRIGPVWREFQRWTHFGPAQLRQAVDARLGRLLDSALAHSAYYRALGVSRQPGQSAESLLQGFPLLSRETVRSHFSDLVADHLRAEIVSPDSVCSRRYGWLVVKTGGTTGHPTTVVHDAAARDWGRATRLFSAQLCGHPLGVRYFRLWGSEQDLLQARAGLLQSVQQALLGYLPMNAFRARERELREHHATLLQHPEIDSMMAYVDAAGSLAQFIRERNLPRPRLRTLMACAGTVTPEWRQLLEETFQAEVFDKYGSRECGDMACECAQHRGLHVYSPNVYLEIVDEDGRPCPPGRNGRVLVTLLNNLSFPLIRYQIGDLAAWAEPADCPCGLAWPRLRDLQGREDDMLTTSEGTALTSGFVRHFVGVSLNRQLLRVWQLEQTEARKFVFRYVPADKKGLADNLARLKASFLLALGRDVEIEMRQVDEIEPSSSGKLRWVINRLRRR